MDDIKSQELISLSDEQMEQIILKKYFTDINYFTIINEFCESRFFQNIHSKKIVNILKKYYLKYEKMPTDNMLKLIFQKYEKKESGTGQAMKREFDTAINLSIEQDEDFVKENVLKFIKHKSAYFSFMDHIDGVTIKGDVSDCLSDFQKILSIGFNDDLGFDYFKEHHVHRDNMANPEFKLSTGYTQIDRVTFGGLPKLGKSMFVIAAQPGLGKSLFMSNFAVNFLQQGLFPVIITLEMSEEMYANRVDAHISSMNINDLRNNLDGLGDKIEGFSQLNPNAKLLIKEFPPNTISCVHIQNYLDKISTLGRKPDVIFVDYINLLKSNSGNNNQGMYERVGDICRELRALSYRYSCPLITATQLNRSGVDTSDVSMDKISESMGTSQTSDFVGALWQQEGDLEACRINMKVLKNRLGGLVGKNMQFNVNYNTLRITDMVDIEEISSTSATESLMTDLEDL